MSRSKAPARRQRLLVGLTGGIATGKTTVAELFAQKGAVVIDADRVARELVEPGQPALTAIAERFGADYIDDGGRLRRDRLGRLVFADPAARRDLEAILHPRIRDEIEARIAASPPGSVVVLDVPLLFEGGKWAERVDVTVVVYADRRTQAARMARRDGLDPVQVEHRLAAQWPTAVKLAKADIAIYNQGNRQSLADQVDDVWERLLKLRDAGDGSEVDEIRPEAAASRSGQDG